MLCNDYRNTSASASSEFWGVVDAQVDFFGLAIIRALTSLDPRWGRSIRAFAMSSLSNPSKPSTFCGLAGLGLAGHGCLAPSSFLEQMTRAEGCWDALTDLRYEWQLESEISLTEAAVAMPETLALQQEVH